MKYTAFLIMTAMVMTTVIAACGSNGDHEPHTQLDAPHDQQGEHAEQEQHATADRTPSETREQHLEGPAAVLFDEALDHYLVLSAVLVESDAGEAAEAAGRMNNTLDRFREAEPGEVTDEKAMGWIDVLQKRSREIESSNEIEAQRESYHELSETMIAMVEAFGHQKDRLYHQRCPMVNGGNGDWLSTGERIMNPYHGDRMLHCGSTVRIL